MVPNSTRWKSTYDSVVVLNNLLERKSRAVHRVMSQQKLPSFTDSDVGFLIEYAQVMSNVAQALDKIQRENQAYRHEVEAGQVQTSPILQSSGRLNTGMHHEKVWALSRRPGVPTGHCILPQVSPVLAGAIY
ncbi:Hypothetical predicted protein [Octopus vulgaris]|uniref:Uncharacterized protein n=1 Tax=Octopus vulgaris TaxID=6645 RepID=A0AA36AG39_OCTVU|nr:Hypothetical predicted protein [Octopus vulgaris]